MSPLILKRTASICRKKICAPLVSRIKSWQGLQTLPSARNFKNSWPFKSRELAGFLRRVAPCPRRSRDVCGRSCALPGTAACGFSTKLNAPTTMSSRIGRWLPRPTGWPSPSARFFKMDHHYVNSVARQSGSNFYFSFFSLPKEKREAITAVYAFCREVDDAVDDPKQKN